MHRPGPRHERAQRLAGPQGREATARTLGVLSHPPPPAAGPCPVRRPPQLQGPGVCRAPAGSSPRAGAAPGGPARTRGHGADPRRPQPPSAAGRRPMSRPPPAAAAGPAPGGPRAGAGRGRRDARATGREDGPGAGARRTCRAHGRRGAGSRGGGSCSCLGPTPRAETRQARSRRGLRGLAEPGARWPELSPPRRPRRASIQGRGRRDPRGSRFAGRHRRGNLGRRARGREERRAQRARRGALRPRREGLEKPHLVALPGINRLQGRRALWALKLPVQNCVFLRSHRMLFFSTVDECHLSCPCRFHFSPPGPGSRKKKNIVSVFRLRGVHIREQQNPHYFVENL